MNRRLVSLAAVTLLGLTAGCTASQDGGRIEPPVAAAPSAPPQAAAPDTSCNPRASLRPGAGSMPAPGQMPAGSHMAAIQKRGRLIIGTSQDTLLFSSRNPFTGAIEGFDVDMGRQVAQAIFGNPDKIQIKVIGYDQRVDLAADGTVDLVADTMTVNCTRLKQVDFSAIYYEAGQRVLVSTDSPAAGIQDLGGKRVCAVAGSTSLDNIAKVGTKPVPVGRTGWADCLVAFQQNEVDAISTDDTILAGLAAQDPYAKVVGDKFTEEPYGMAISKQYPEFTRFVNQVLERNKADGTWKRTYEKWLHDFGRAPQPPQASYR
ncbi:glutamate ABC transporter substrate-binding protein [Actinoplanes sp. NBRC 103695]|uniref:glutamate ABC transporter substrate-binding protein n=1 Tax=Actinoplanes sp. NBRC 103695 TaxID=3032202 RepID=UPI0024A497B4|nr:glutamate ABC transporter substrate-binding protein [Actinoplanes sp. NBRC 103695]GLZ00653.1 putative glutamine-binding protein GlnH [Actinoplanes sp. NBRC 103695]